MGLCQIKFQLEQVKPGHRSAGEGLGHTARVYCRMLLAFVSTIDSITSLPLLLRQAATHCPCIVIFTRSLSLSALLWPSRAGSSQMSELGDRSPAS